MSTGEIGENFLLANFLSYLVSPNRCKWCTPVLVNKSTPHPKCELRHCKDHAGSQARWRSSESIARLASSPGHFQIFISHPWKKIRRRPVITFMHKLSPYHVQTESTIFGLWRSSDPRPDFSPWLWDKIWEWPRDEATAHHPHLITQHLSIYRANSLGRNLRH